MRPAAQAPLSADPQPTAVSAVPVTTAMPEKVVTKMPPTSCAVSVGVVGGVPLLDLDYAEDARCDTDMNVVMTGAGGFVELQGTAERAAFSRAEFAALLSLAEQGIAKLHAAQRAALET